MTEQEAKALVEWFKVRKGKTLKLNDDGIDCVIEALEKQIPIQHYHTRIDHINDSIRTSVCPCCLGFIYTFKDDYPIYCSHCGQKLEWN